jgi:hypothetical protein
MSHNLLEQLTKAEIPPPPRDMRRQVHQRLNQWLVAFQMGDMLLRAFVYAAGHFALAVVSLIFFTLTGKHVTRQTAADTEPTDQQEE